MTITVGEKNDPLGCVLLPPDGSATKDCAMSRQAFNAMSMAVTVIPMGRCMIEVSVTRFGGGGRLIIAAK